MEGRAAPLALGRGLNRIGLLVALLAIPAQAAVSEDFAIRYYAVDARKGRSLDDALAASSPISATGPSGQRFHGYTEWYVKWSWRHRFEADGRCRITSVDVALTGSMLLPRLTGGTVRQNTVFDRYLTSLREHEEGHRRIAQEAARDIERTLLSLPEYPDCRRLEAEANARARARLDEHVEREKSYDRDTGHGRTQGAVLQD